jgi:hypothetical protein
MCAFSTSVTVTCSHWIRSSRSLANQALHSDRGLSSVLHKLFSRVPAQAPAPFSAPPRSAKLDVPRRVNASIVRQTTRGFDFPERPATLSLLAGIFRRECKRSRALPPFVLSHLCSTPALAHRFARRSSHEPTIPTGYCLTGRCTPTGAEVLACIGLLCVAARRPPLFPASPRSAKLGPPRRVNAQIVGQTVTFAHRHGLPAFSISLRPRPA